MSDSTFIYTETSDLKIYKYIPLEYLIKMLCSNTLYISKVDAWEDVYENFFLKQQFTINGKIVNPTLVKENFKGIFGQSWTSLKSSDAMWRIYSKRESDSCNEKEMPRTAIRISSTPRLIYKELCHTNLNDNYGVEMHEIEYMPQDELVQWLDNINVVNRHNMVGLMLKSLFIKRNDFEHEHEVRLIVSVKSNCKNANNNALIIPIQAQNIITEYAVDPRMNEQQYSTIHSLLTRNGADENLIRQSSLYTLVRKTLVLEC